MQNTCDQSRGLGQIESYATRESALGEQTDVGQQNLVELFSAQVHLEQDLDRLGTIERFDLLLGEVGLEVTMGPELRFFDTTLEGAGGILDQSLQ